MNPNLSAALAAEQIAARRADAIRFRRPEGGSGRFARVFAGRRARRAAPPIAVRARAA